MLHVFQLAIQAANPSGTPEGWENVAKSLGGERTAEECKKVWNSDEHQIRTSDQYRAYELQIRDNIEWYRV